jgi:hypothetical protein
MTVDITTPVPEETRRFQAGVLAALGLQEWAKRKGRGPLLVWHRCLSRKI